MVKTIMSGGGIQSNKTVQSRSGGKVEPVTHRGNVAGVAQTGLSHAFSLSQCCKAKVTNLNLCQLPELKAPSTHRGKAPAHRERFMGKAVKLSTTLARSQCGQRQCRQLKTR